MVKLIILNNNNKNSEIGARKTKATYKNNEISEKVTWSFKNNFFFLGHSFSIGCPFFSFSFFLLGHFQVDVIFFFFFLPLYKGLIREHYICQDILGVGVQVSQLSIIYNLFFKFCKKNNLFT